MHNYFSKYNKVTITIIEQIAQIELVFCIIAETYNLSSLFKMNIKKCAVASRYIINKEKQKASILCFSVKIEW